MELCDISVEELLAHQCSVHIRQGADAGAHTVSMGSPKKKRLPTSITNATVAASEQELIPAVQTKFSNSSTATPPAAQNTPEGEYLPPYLSATFVLCSVQCVLPA